MYIFDYVSLLIRQESVFYIKKILLEIYFPVYENETFNFHPAPRVDFFSERKGLNV